jgi:hypothetical protein
MCMIGIHVNVAIFGNIANGNRHKKIREYLHYAATMLRVSSCMSQ